MDLVKSDQTCWRYLKWFIIALVILLVVSVILQGIGLGTQGWMIWIIPNVEIHYGLFKYETCVSKKCVTNSTDSKDFEDSADLFIPGIPSLESLQAETISGLVICVISMVTLIVTLIRRREYKIGLIIACITSCLSAILALVAAGQVARLTKKRHDKLDPSPFDFPYSLVLTGLGGIFAAICFLALFGILVSRSSLYDCATTHKPQVQPPDERVHYASSRPEHVYYQPQVAQPYRSSHHSSKHSPDYHVQQMVYR